MIYENEILKISIYNNGDIIFSSNEDNINEAFYYKDNKKSIMVRNKKNDNISHH